MTTVATLLAVSTAFHAVNREIELIRTFWAVAWVESRGDPRAVKADENAVGIVQIRPIMVRDCNRIIGYAKWTLADRLDVERSWQMFRLYSRYYAPNGTPEIWSRNWNGGPQGHKKSATLKYWRLVQSQL
jgi:hypothetical protein